MWTEIKLNNLSFPVAFNCTKITRRIKKNKTQRPWTRTETSVKELEKVFLKACKGPFFTGMEACIGYHSLPLKQEVRQKNPFERSPGLDSYTGHFHVSLSLTTVVFIKTRVSWG